MISTAQFLFGKAGVVHNLATPLILASKLDKASWKTYQLKLASGETDGNIYMLVISCTFWASSTTCSEGTMAAMTVSVLEITRKTPLESSAREDDGCVHGEGGEGGRHEYPT